MVKSSEQQGEGIDMGIPVEAIQDRKKMWANRRMDLRKEMETKYAEDLHEFEGKSYSSELNSRVRQEIRQRLKKGQYEDLREKVMYESWDLLETGLDVEKMTPVAVENLLDTFVEQARKAQPDKETDEQAAVRQKEEDERHRARMKESFRASQERESERGDAHALADEMKEKKESLEMAKWMQTMLDEDQAVENDPEKRKEQFERWKQEHESEPEKEVA